MSMGRVYQRNKYWYIDYYEPFGARVRKKISLYKKHAEEALKKIEIQIAEGRYLDKKKSPQKMLLKDFIEGFINNHCKVHNKSWIKSQEHLKFFEESFPMFYLDEITPKMIAEFLAKQRVTYKPATVNRRLSCIKTLYNKAIEWGDFIGEHPAHKIKKMRENNARLRYLSEAEIQTLLSNSSGYLRSVIIVALHTGMRFHEIMHLKWKVNTNFPYVNFEEEIICLPSSQYFSTKNNEIRVIPMNKFVIEALGNMSQEGEYVFRNKEGKPFRDIRKSFKSALKRSGLEDFRFHDLRHTFASHLVMCGIDLNTVKELLGHKSLDMTLRYSHLSPMHKKTAVDRLGAKMDNTSSCLGTIWAQTASFEKTRKINNCVNI